MAPVQSDPTPLGMSSFLRPSGQQRGQEDSWEFPNSESHNEGSPDEMTDVQMNRNREGMLSDDAEGSPDSPPQPITPEEYDQLVHPLQAVADRVGREAERFAEQLERLTPHQGDDQSKRYRLALELVEQYEGIAKGSVLRLRELHAPQQRTLFADYWQRKRKAPGTGRDVRLSEADLENAMPSSREYDGPPEPTLADLWYWRHEQQTWTLLRRLLEFQCPKPIADAENEKRRRLDALGDVHRYSSEEKVWARFLIDDDLARERQTVVTWLQESAEISGNDVEIMTGQLDSVVEDGLASWAPGWTDTREAIKAQKRLRSWPRILDPSSPGLAASHVNADRTVSLVTQLDPDAVTRERRMLEHPDQLYERFIWMTCWQMLRRGRSWSDIQEWCREKSEAWRALSLRGGTYTRQLPGQEDALSALIDLSLGRRQGGNYDDDGDDLARRPHVQGNHHGPLWRRMCYALARDGGVDPWERAVYGALGGDLNSLQVVSSSWDDIIYAHYNSLVLGQYDTYLQAHYPERLPPSLARKFGRFDSVQYHGEAEAVGGRLVEQLKTHESTVRESHESMKLIQGALIAKTFKQFARQQGFALSKSANAEERSKIIPTLEEMSEEGVDIGLVNLDDLDGVRVLCHMLFIFVDLGMDLGFGNQLIAFENIVVAYIDFLRLSGKISMVPLYASRLSRLRQLHTLGLVLLDIPSPRRRTELVSLMQGYGIDVYQVIRSQMRYLFDQGGLNRPLDDLVDVAPLDIMEDSTAVIHMGRKIRRDFLGQDYTENEAAVVSSFEWFLYLNGYWAETFEAGVSLYTRFYLTKQLRAARGLARFMSTATISYAKTEALLGESMDVVEDGWLVDDDSRRTSFSEPQVHSSSTTTAAAASNRPKLTRRVLASQAKLYRELEGLIRVLCAFQDWRVVIDQQPTNVDLRRATSWKTEVQRSYDEVVDQVRPLLHGWLLDVPEHQVKTCNLIRNIYLPEILLAYVNVLYTAGHVLSRGILLECMNLSTVVAAPQSDLLPCLLDTTRLPDLVAAFAVVSRAILRAEEQRGGGLLNGGSIGGGGGGGRGKSLRRRHIGKSGGNGHQGGDGDGGVDDTTNPSAAATAATPTTTTTTTTATTWTSSRKRRGKMENMNIWHVEPS